MAGDANRKVQEKQQRWRQRADAAFQRMWANGELTTFTDHEEEAMLIARELAAFLLEEKMAEHALARPTSQEQALCPKCNQPGKRLTKAKEKLPQRTLTTRAGEVTLHREKWRCQSCRVIFFSDGSKVEVGHGRLQSASAAKGSASGGQGGLLQGGQ